MMDEALVSVIVPIYNVEKYLRICLDTIVNQTYKNLEIILIVDGATDLSGLICQEYQKKDSRVIVIVQENAGLSAARNTGMSYSHGSLLVLLIVMILFIWICEYSCAAEPLVRFY